MIGQLNMTYNPNTEKVVPKDAIVLKDLSPLPAKNPAFVVRQWGALVRDDWPGITKLLKSIGDQIEEQTKPPRIPEPELYGLVKAGPPHDRRVWVRGAKGWTMVDATGQYLNWNHWDNLENPERL